MFFTISALPKYSEEPSLRYARNCTDRTLSVYLLIGGPFFIENPGQVRLVYGVPDSDDTSLVFICDKGSAVLSAYLTHLPVRAATGARLPVRMSNRPTIVDFSGTVRTQEMGDLLHLQGQVPFDASFEAMLATQGLLMISAGGFTAHYAAPGDLGTILWTTPNRCGIEI